MKENVKRLVDEEIRQAIEKIDDQRCGLAKRG